MKIDPLLCIENRLIGFSIVRGRKLNVAASSSSVLHDRINGPEYDEQKFRHVLSVPASTRYNNHLPQMKINKLLFDTLKHRDRINRQEKMVL